LPNCASAAGGNGTGGGGTRTRNPQPDKKMLVVVKREMIAKRIETRTEHFCKLARRPSAALLLDYDGTLRPSVWNAVSLPYPGVTPLINKIIGAGRHVS